MDDLLRRRWGDFLLAVAVVAVALGLWAALLLFSQSGGAVTVTVDGELYATLPLADDTALEIIGIGGVNTLEIAGGEARMTAADCPDGVCVHHRAISHSGESIVCLPHRVTVTVVGGSAGVDGEV